MYLQLKLVKISCVFHHMLLKISSVLQGLVLYLILINKTKYLVREENSRLLNFNKLEILPFLFNSAIFTVGLTSWFVFSNVSLTGLIIYFCMDQLVFQKRSELRKRRGCQGLLEKNCMKRNLWCHQIWKNILGDFLTFRH